MIKSSLCFSCRHSPVLRRYLGVFQKPQVFVVKILGILKNPMYWCHYFGVIRNPQVFDIKNTGFWLVSKSWRISPEITIRYRADCALHDELYRPTCILANTKEGTKQRVIIYREQTRNCLWSQISANFFQQCCVAFLWWFTWLGFGKRGWGVTHF